MIVQDEYDSRVLSRGCIRQRSLRERERRRVLPESEMHALLHTQARQARVQGPGVLLRESRNGRHTYIHVVRREIKDNMRIVTSILCFIL